MDNIKVDAEFDNVTADILSSEGEPSINLDGFVSHMEASESGADIGLDLLVNKKKQLEEPIRETPTMRATMNDIMEDDSDEGLPEETHMGGGVDEFDVPNPHLVEEDVASHMSFASKNDFRPSTTRPTYSSMPTSSFMQKKLEEEKLNLLYKFEELERRGIKVPRKFTTRDDLEEIRYEYNKLKNRREVEASVKFSRKMLMACVTGIEYLNGRFDPFDVKLEGWSESVHENINDYDEIFEELHEKYKGAAKMSPEIKLLLSLGGSAFMFHLTNTMFKSSLPGMGDIMKQNPELMKQFASAAMKSMNGGGDMGGMPMGMGGMDMGGMGGMDMSDDMGFMGGNPASMSPTQRRDMRGPEGVDDILQELQNELDMDETSSLDLSSKPKKRRRKKRNSAPTFS